MQIIEVRLCAVQGRADGQLCTNGLSGFGSRLHAGVPCLALLHGLAIVVSAEDDLPVGILVPGHAGHGLKVSRIEGHKAGVARGKVQACGGGVSFRYEQGAILGAVLCRNGEVAARRFAALQKELVRPVSGLFRQDALQAHQRAGSIQHRQQQLYNALTLPLPDATKSRDTFPLQVRVCIRCTSRSFPDGPGQLGRRGPACGLFFFGSFPGSGDAFPQGLAFGRGQVFGRSGRPRSFITGDPVLPPAAGRIIQVDTVGPVLAAGLVRGAATVQHAVCLDVFHQQPGSPQALFKGAQDVTIHGRPLPVRDPTAGAGRAHAAARQGGRRAPRRR